MRIFVDRVDPQKIFWTHYEKLRDGGSKIISFYGAGGLGKTRLAEKLMDEFAAQKVDGVKYLFHDFINGTDMRSVLRRWKVELQTFGCEFPLFDTGDFFLFVKQGKKRLTAQQFQAFLGKSKWFGYVAQSSESFADNFMPGVNSVAAALDITSDMLHIFPGVKTFAQLAGVVDKMLAKREHDKKLANHAEIREEIYRRFEKPNPRELEKFLPMLFAQDVADWLNATDNKLIIFLETYELLAGALSGGDELAENNLHRDWWLRNDTEGEEGLIFTLPDTLWVISGRNKLRWTGELADALEDNQFLLGHLSQEDSLDFLTQAGVKSPELREELFKLTEGYPLYLNVCVDTYRQDPTIEDFGQDRERIIERLMKYMDEDSRLMIDGAAILGAWTDDMAQKIIYGYDPNVYLNVKKFSFIHRRDVPLDDDKLEVFRFDRTLQKFILDVIKADEDLNWLTDETLTAAEKYFEPLLDGREFIDETFCFYLKLWAELIVNLTDDAELLQTRYEENLSGFVSNLIDVYEVTTAEDIITAFQDKVVALAGEENIPCAYFDGELSRVLDERGDYEGATVYAELKYEKYSKLLGEKHPKTIDALITVSFRWKYFGEFGVSEELCEELLEKTKEVFGEDDPRTTFVMENLAEIYDTYGRHKQALELEEKVLKFRRENFGEEDYKTVCSMMDMAVMLMKFDDRLDEALMLGEKALEYFKKNFDEDYKLTIVAMSNVASILRKMERYEEALSMTEKALKLSKETFGGKHPLTITIMFNLSNILSNLGRDEEALKLTEQAFTLRKEVLGKGHVETIRAMHYLAEELQEAGRHQESAALWKEQIEMIYIPDENGDIRNHIDSEFDATDENDFDGALNLLNPMIHLASALLNAGEKNEALSWADHALALGEKFFPVLAETDNEFYDRVNPKRSLEGLREWHAIFLKKFNGEEVSDFNEYMEKISILIPRTMFAIRHEVEED